MKHRNTMTWLVIAAMLAMNAAPAKALAADEDPASAPATSEELYTPIIESMRTRLTQGFSHYMEEDQVLYGVLLNDPDAFSYLWYHDPNLTASNTGYTIFDLDGDGRDELVLGTLDEDGNGTIYDLYTQYEGNVYHIAAAGERDHFALTNRGTIVEEGSASASLSITIFYEIGKNCLEVSSGFQYDSLTGTNYTIASYLGNEDDSAYEFTWKETEETAEAFAYQNIRLTPFLADAEQAFDHYLSDLIRSLAEEDYEAKTGTAPAASACVIDGTLATVTLTDAEGNVLDVYNVNTASGMATNQKGNEIDLTVYLNQIDESEYFVEFEYMGDVAKKYYMEQHEVRPRGSSTLVNPKTGNITIELYGENVDSLIAYTIDPRTGIGTDSEGNAVDLSAYAGYQPLTEADFAVPLNILDDAAKAYYTDQTGSEASGVMIDYELDTPACQITLQDDEMNDLEVYSIDPTTGIGTDSKANVVDFAAYVKAHNIVDNNPITEPELIDETDFFAPTENIIEYVKRDVSEKKGIQAEGYTYGYDEETKTFAIELYSENDELIDTYTINAVSGLGANSAGDTVDLLPYAKQDAVPAYFTSLEEMSRMALIDYEKKTGIAVEVSEIVTSRENGETVITMTLTDKNGNILDAYIINPFTGAGFNSAGGEVNLPQTGNNAPGAAATAAGALILTITGLFGMAKSGLIRRKEDR